MLTTCPLCGHYITHEEVVSTQSRLRTYLTYCGECSANYDGTTFTGFEDERIAADRMMVMLADLMVP